jgi:pyruvate dehydrogenase E2 component (dihydrolipoamide acetyltransferase)
MSVDVIMPQMGESIFEGTITKWLKKPGETVDRDEPLFEISTDKVDAEIPSPAAGVLKEIKVNEGQTVPIQTIVAVIDAAGAAAVAPAPSKKDAVQATGAERKSEMPPGAPTPAAKGAKKAEAEAPAASAQADGAPSAKETDAEATQRAEIARKAEMPSGAAKPAPPATPQAAAPVAGAPSKHDGKIRSSPLVRRLAREHSIDLTQVPGSGAGGRISKRDILAAIESGTEGAAAVPSPGGAAPAAGAAGPPPMPPAGAAVRLETAVPRERMYFGHYEVQPMSVMRQKIAEHMVASKRVSPHVYSIDEADLTAVAELRARSKTEFEKSTGTKLTFMPFFVRACVEALRAFPTVNSSVDGTNVVLHRECNIGIAVALDWGLIVPVIKNAEEKNFLGLARAINDLAERARTKKLKPEEVAESTFSITNPGVFGGLMGLPVINQPNVAILGLGAIQKRPVVIHDAIAIRSMVYLTLSYDHRVVDGAVAHQFMGKVKSLLENWTEAVL